MPAPARRPFWKRKRIIIPVTVLAVLIAIGSAADQETTTSQAGYVVDTTTTSNTRKALFEWVQTYGYPDIKGIQTMMRAELSVTPGDFAHMAVVCRAMGEQLEVVLSHPAAPYPALADVWAEVLGHMTNHVSLCLSGAARRSDTMIQQASSETDLAVAALPRALALLKEGSR